MFWHFGKKLQQNIDDGLKIWLTKSENPNEYYVGKKTNEMDTKLREK